MKNTIYQEIIDKVLDECDLYTKNKITSRHLQQIIYWLVFPQNSHCFT